MVKKIVRIQRESLLREVWETT